MMIFRLYHETRGGHVHCRLFAGPHDGALGKCGDLVMRVEEFKLFKAAATFMQFIVSDRMTCLRDQCRSPVACQSFGHCREQRA